MIGLSTSHPNTVETPPQPIDLTFLERQARMSVEIRVPSLGESIVDAVIATWLKNEGDPIQQGDALVELETDKVNVEVSAEQGGILQQVLKKEGDVVVVGEVLGILSENGGVALPGTDAD